MDEVRRLCVRLVGEPAGAAAAEAAGRAAAGSDRAGQLRAALLACRQGQAARAGAADGGADAVPARSGADAAGRRGLADAIAGELRHAVAQLEPSEREALALRDLLELSYGEIAAVTDSDPERVALLLAAARLRLRERLRGPGQPQPECPERERALRTIAARQDEQPVPSADEDWLIEHLGHCGGCAQAHAAMLEAVACYRAWSAAEDPGGAPAGPSEPGHAPAAGAGA